MVVDQKRVVLVVVIALLSLAAIARWSASSRPDPIGPVGALEAVDRVRLLEQFPSNLPLPQDMVATQDLALIQLRGITPPPQPTPHLVRTPMTADELGISLDPDGYPYETAVYAESTRVELIGTLSAPGGRIRTMDGIAATFDPSEADSYAPDIDFGSVDALDVQIIYSHDIYDGEGYDRVLGVRLDAPGATVARWSAFETAYGTDGGLGAIVSQSLLDHVALNPLDGEDLVNFDSVIDMEHYQILDLDGQDGFDFIIFSNGWGDGGFPLSRGYDATGQLVSVFVLDERRHPWELFVPDGTPPSDVTKRRQQLQDCIDGERDIQITEWGNQCVLGD